MLTQLGAFSHRFEALVRPALPRLDDAIAAAEATPADVPGRGLLGPLREARHQLRSLCDKVAEQQAYVLVFGPLKSGKSTLMNALAGAYVSEVTSLPAYPCLVFVGAGPRREYVVTRHDGARTTWADARDCAAHVETAHGELAAALRAAEQQGVAFEPQQHFPAAIRRIDVRVPDSELASTGAVLVDTPGLYTRMRFGYDRMTREFRDAAACAVYVVRTDTLFLEQAFAEFHRLLDLFSRVFLVVNVDSRKRDVSPDGKLVPSLEQSHPERVVEAFERLAMTAPLAQAHAQGRLRLFPVDLMRAASHALRKEPGEAAPADFAAFQGELTAFLGSAEYIAAFLRDSLQRARAVLGDAGLLLAGPDAQRLQQGLVAAAERAEWLAAEERRAAAAAASDLVAAFAPLATVVTAEAERAVRDCGAKLLRGLGAAIDTWFLSGHSLHWLLHDQWRPLVREFRDDVTTAVRRAVESALAVPGAGVALPAATADLLARAGVDLRTLLLRTLEQLGTVAWPDEPVVPIDFGAIPLRRSVVDLVTFRSLDRVRERLLGPATAPDAKVTAKDKAARLGETGRLHLHQCVTRYRGELGPATTATLRRHFDARFVAAADAALRQALAAYGPALRAERDAAAAARERLQALAAPLRELAAAVHARLDGLHELGRAFAIDLAALPPRPSAAADEALRRPEPVA
jgi:energy-coupling factor transporter ATP-binding protein EcfA2